MSFLCYVLSTHVILRGFYYRRSPTHASDWWQSDWAAQGGHPVVLPRQWERNWCSPYLPGKWVRWWKHSHVCSLSVLDGLHVVGISATITSCLWDNTDGIGLLCPLFGTETETVQPCLRFNYVDFGTIKIRIHQPLPYSKELNGIGLTRWQTLCQSCIAKGAGFLLHTDWMLRFFDNFAYQKI